MSAVFDIIFCIFLFCVSLTCLLQIQMILSLLSFRLPTSLFFFFHFSWLCWVFVAVCGLSLVALSGSYSCCRVSVFPLQWFLMSQSTSSRHVGLVVMASRIFLDRGLNLIPCLGRWILNHWTTREVHLHTRFKCDWFATFPVQTSCVSPLPVRFFLV